MAKDKKTVEIKDVTTENVSEVLKKINVFSEEEVKLSDENDAEEMKKRKANELSRLKTKANYQNTRLVLAAKYNKAALKAQEEARNKSLELVEKVKKGEITINEYDEEMDKIIDASVKKVEEASKELGKDLKELRDAVPGGIWYQYENPFNRINRAIERGGQH